MPRPNVPWRLAARPARRLRAYAGRGAPLLQQLVAHWRLDETSGPRADAHGASPLTDNNTVAGGTGKLGGAAQFTRANSEYLSAADSAGLSVPATSYTWALWANLDSVAHAEQFLVHKFGANGGYRLRHHGGNARFEAQHRDSGGGVTQVNSAAGAWSTGTWYFLVFWFDAAAGTLNLQVNDGSVASAAGVGAAGDDTAGLYLGSEDGTGHYADGRLDSVSFWKRTLTAAERTALYNAGAGLDYPF
jgi:hypothetical protein